MHDELEEKCINAVKTRFQHNANECKAVGDLLAYLENWPEQSGFNDLGIEGKLEVYWAGSVMGYIEDDGDGGFHYYPLAFGQKGEREQHGKNI
jgi:hypothetical protein